ncbi:MAG: YihY/virulence factor BrkB family protein [Actinomycetota bacterium]
MTPLERLERIALPPEGATGRLADLRRLTVRTAVDTFDDRVPGLAAEMAFFAVLSLPPLLLAVLGSVGFVVGGLPESDLVRLESEILDFLGTFLSRSTVDEVLSVPVGRLLREGRSDVLSLGVVLTLWSASRATNVVLRTITRAYDLDDTRPGWKRRLLAMVITVVGIVLAVGAIPLLVVGPRVFASVVDAAGLSPDLIGLWSVVYWAGVIAVVLVALTWLYHVAPGWYTPWLRDLPGAVLALVVWLLAGWGLRIYTAELAGFTSDDAFRGLAAPLVLLLWVYLSSIAVLLGAELNAELERIWPSEKGPYDEPQERR